MGQEESKPTPTPPPPPPPKVENDHPWRSMPWGKKHTLVENIKMLTLSTSDVSCIKILLVGEIGVGKSSFINSVNNVFRGRITSGALAGACGTSFTKTYKTHYVIEKDGTRLPFALMDIMGLERFESQGVHIKDIFSAIMGNLDDGYKFNPVSPASKDDPKYKDNPSISDQAFCVVNVVDANRVSFMEDEIVKKLAQVREEATQFNLPQIVIMTKVDEVCPLVNKDLRKIYTSIKIEDKVKECSNLLGIPINHIFPVKNYHKEVDLNDDMDVLILKALEQIVNLSNDALEERMADAKHE